ncbi:hypothetical protein AXF42_Ash004151 [Apostasia shenzhenica]|uniref:Secreted protein n=1 Tax=Apostasia shenzhenica TaxID=1088818 RepID=A0A2I0A236_9ASPA|nr:hypothetical protein AXF42_Ash004151 [Apostasia shenzhenica]
MAYKFLPSLVVSLLLELAFISDHCALGGAETDERRKAKRPVQTSLSRSSPPPLPPLHLSPSLIGNAEPPNPLSIFIFLVFPACGRRPVNFTALSGAAPVDRGLGLLVSRSKGGK